MLSSRANKIKKGYEAESLTSVIVKLVLLCAVIILVVVKLPEPEETHKGVCRISSLQALDEGGIRSKSYVHIHVIGDSGGFTQKEFHRVNQTRCNILTKLNRRGFDIFDIKHMDLIAIRQSVIRQPAANTCIIGIKNARSQQSCKHE